MVNSSIFSILLLVVVLAGYWLVKKEIYSLNEERLVHKNETESNWVMVSLEETLKEYSDLLYTMRGLIMASEEVTRTEWAEYTNSLKLKEDYPSVSSLEFIKRIPGDKISDFQRQVNSSLKTLGINERVYKIYPSGERQEYYVVDYLEPYVGLSLIHI